MTAYRAFTLVELLTVMAILAVLAGLLIGGFAFARRSAEDRVTSHRVQAVLAALQGVGQEGGQGVRILMQRALTTRQIAADGSYGSGRVPDDFRLRPLREVIQLAADGATLDALATRRTGIVPNWAFIRPAAACTALPFAFVGKDWIPFNDAGSAAQPARPAAHPGAPADSAQGERLDQTLEVSCEGVAAPGTAWFRRRWPTAWPASDWEDDPPGAVPVRWGSPWGRPGFAAAADGVRPLDAAEDRHLGQLSPLDTIALLQVAEVLEAGPPGATAYRGDRGRNRPWNDAWGNPLVVVSAAFMPPRVEAAAAATFANLFGGGAQLGGLYPKAWELLGYGTNAAPMTTYARGQPRDAMVRAFRDRDGTTQAVYLAVAACGPVVRETLPSGWTAAEDPATLARLWRQIREVCAADQWDRDGFATAPWSGVRIGRLDPGERCFLSTPIEIR